jgi:hypothetical protein
MIKRLRAWWQRRLHGEPYTPLAVQNSGPWTIERLEAELFHWRANPYLPPLEIDRRPYLPMNQQVTSLAAETGAANWPVAPMKALGDPTRLPGAPVWVDMPMGQGIGIRDGDPIPAEWPNTP